MIVKQFSTDHTQLAIDNAAKYNIEVVDGQKFLTYANVKPVHRQLLSTTLSGSPTLDTNNFKLQNTIVESDFNEPLFTVPYGFTKARIYVWVEGQDIDSLETLSTGTNVDITINFVKDTAGYDQFDEE